MSTGDAITPPQSNGVQIPSFSVNHQQQRHQQQQQHQHQFQNTLSHLFPGSVPNPFNFPTCLNAFAASVVSSSAAVPPNTLGLATISQQANHMHAYNNERIKIKRCRQRVDAGEPRNSYQSQLKHTQKKEPINLNDNVPIHFYSHNNNETMYNNNNSNNNDTTTTAKMLRLCEDGALSENEYIDEYTDESAIRMEDMESTNENECKPTTSRNTNSSSSRRKNCQPKRQHASQTNANNKEQLENGRECNNNDENDENQYEENNSEIIEESEPNTGKEESYTSETEQIKFDKLCDTISNNDFTLSSILDEEDNDNNPEANVSLSENKLKKEEQYATNDDEDNVEDDYLKTENGSQIYPEELEVKRSCNQNCDSEIFGVDENDDSTKKMTNAVNHEEINVSLLSSLFSNNNVADSEKSEVNNFSNFKKFQEMLEFQRKLYSTIFADQERRTKKFNDSMTDSSTNFTSDNDVSPSATSSVTETQRPADELKMGNSLSIFGHKKPNSNEHFGNLLRFFEAISSAQRQQQQMAELLQQKQRIQPQAQAHAHLVNSSMPANFLGLNPTLATLAAAAATAAATNNRNANAANLSPLMHPSFRRLGVNDSTTFGSNGIFPTTSVAAFPNLANVPFFHRTSPSVREEYGPRRKRAKVTDSVRGPRSSIRADCTQSCGSQSISERSSPQTTTGSCFPPIMVASGYATGSRNTSPGEQFDATTNASHSSDFFGANVLTGALHQQMYTLTHVHLRKAKLMFFYTRYPSSAVLKTYFPDIHFNKNNTAQLVKWFSNFREFYYMQMEKYAKQAIAEGIRDRNDIAVTSESEIYKQLNQHYNRNNLIQPPARLQFVVQETLKEFFVALLNGRDSEASWKKVIYKVIQQLDEPIPDYFKNPNFIETLERG